jgi:hypothetical protein
MGDSADIGAFQAQVDFLASAAVELARSVDPA